MEPNTHQMLKIETVVVVWTHLERKQNLPVDALRNDNTGGFSWLK